MVRLLLFATVFVFMGCAPDSQVEFRICGKLIVPSQLDALRVSILDDALKEKNFALIELTEREIAKDGGVLDGATSGKEAQNSAKDAGPQGAKDTATQQASSSKSIRSLPVTASLSGNDGSGYVRVQALLKGSEVARFDRRIPNLGKTTKADMPLTEDCYGKYNCSRGQTCVKGACVVAPIGTDPPACN
jgi:hypothetical protein